MPDRLTAEERAAIAKFNPRRIQKIPRGVSAFDEAPGNPMREQINNDWRSITGGGPRAKAVRFTVDGRTFVSMSSCAREIGLTEAVLQKARNEKRLKEVVRARLAEIARAKGAK